MVFFQFVHSQRNSKFQKNSREITAPLFLLQCVQPGINTRGLDLLTIGMVNDMFVEGPNDEYNYPAVAAQEQMDKF
ncbi:MAG: hypothetical protein LUI10_00795 [Lachnospiraceae bacterium]|nr:hypothetical protein [Lachnospiraceae bacterium]